MKQIVIIMCVALLPRLAMGQCHSSQQKPDWVENGFRSAPYSTFQRFKATGDTEEEARNKAMDEVVKAQSLATGKRMHVETVNGEVTVKGSDELTVKSRVIHEYGERCGSTCNVYLLVQTAKNPSSTMEDVLVTDKYLFSPRVFVPGMAQIHKGSTEKGIAFIAGEALMVGGIVVAESLRASDESKINSTHSANLKQNYIDKADMYSNIRNVAVAGAVAVYVWNVIDGWVAKGKTHILIGENKLNIAPYATSYSTGISLAIKF
jgi:hypothetical protein